MKRNNFLYFFIYIITFILINNIHCYSQILINEFSASNSQVITDEAFDTPDWIELYNKSDKSVNLKGYRIGKKSRPKFAYELPDTTIGPHEYLILFCDNKNYISSNYELTSNGKNYMSTFETEFKYYYLELNNAKEFELELKLLSMSNYTSESKIGLMVREQLKDYSVYAGIFISSPIYERYFYAIRETTDAPSNLYYYAENLKYPFAHIIMKLENDTLKMYRSEDTAGIHREKIARIAEFHIKNSKYYIGIATTSGEIDTTTKFIVNKFKINGKEVDIQSLKEICIGSDIEGNVKKHKTIHTNFNLNKDGNQIYLFDNLGNKIDYIEYNKQLTDISYGRYPDGSNNFVYFEIPTPEKTNNNVIKKQIDGPSFSLLGGFYDSTISLELTNKDKNISDIYYTIDGSELTTNSLIYKNTIFINKTTVLRAKAISKDNNFNSSKIITQTYFINENSTLPVVSIVVDSLFLWNEKDGILVEKNLYKDKIVPANFEYFKNTQSIAYNSIAGLRLNGNQTRTYPQKSWRLYAEDYYQSSTFEYPFFENTYINNYSRLILRNAGNDWEKGFIRDQLAHSIGKNLNKYLIHSPVKNVLTFLNGKFYGISNLIERHDKSFFENQYNIDKNSITMAEFVTYYILPTTKYGSPYLNLTEWFEFFDTLIFLDMHNNGLEYIESKIDIENFIDYFILNIFIQNRDWLSNNVLFWKSNELDNKWRWKINDMDVSFAFDKKLSESHNNYFELLTSNSYICNLLKTLFKSKVFFNKFLNRFADLLNTEFLPKNLIPKIDNISSTLAPEIKRQQALYPESCIDWEDEIIRIKDFLANRKEKQTLHIREIHKLARLYKINISSNIQNACTFKVNSLNLEVDNWEGMYFQEIPITITVKPNKNYKFIGWNTYDTNKTIIINLPNINDTVDTCLYLEAIFETNTEHINIEFTEYPNPIQNNFNINIKTDNPVIANMEIIDIMGNKIYERNLNCYKDINNIFNLSFEEINVTNGVYFINIQTEKGKILTKKIIYKKT